MDAALNLTEVCEVDKDKYIDCGTYTVTALLHLAFPFTLGFTIFRLHFRAAVSYIFASVALQIYHCFLQQKERAVTATVLLISLLG